MSIRTTIYTCDECNTDTEHPYQATIRKPHEFKNQIRANSFIGDATFCSPECLATAITRTVKTLSPDPNEEP